MIFSAVVSLCASFRLSINRSFETTNGHPGPSSILAAFAPVGATFQSFCRSCGQLSLKTSIGASTYCHPVDSRACYPSPALDDCVWTRGSSKVDWSERVDALSVSTRAPWSLSS